MRKHFCRHLHSSLISMQKSVSSFDSNQKPVDVRLTNFKQARISHSISDVITLMMTSMGPKVRFRQILRGRCFVPQHLLHFFCKIQHCPSPINIKHYYIFPSVYLSVCLQIKSVPLSSSLSLCLFASLSLSINKLIYLSIFPPPSVSLIYRLRLYSFNTKYLDFK